MLSLRGANPANANRAARSPGLLAALVVFAIGCLAYWAAAGVYFVKDDLAMSTLTDAAGNPSFDVFFQNFVWPATMTHDQFYRPLPILFAFFDLTVFGVDPAGFRVCNIGFHALNAVLLGILLNQLTAFRRPAAGWFAGLLFALHPLHGEAVLWVTQRMVVQCATFSLLSLIALESFLCKRSVLAAAVCALSALAAALCKEVTVTLPAAMVAIAFTRPAPDRATRVGRTVRVAAFGAVLSLFVLVMRRVAFGVWAGTYGKLTTAEYAKHFRVFERMPQSLLDGFWAVNSLEVPGRARLAFGIAFLAFLAFFLWRLVRSLPEPGVRRAALVFGAFALASFLPTMFIFQVEPTLTHGRFLYQPLAGVLGLLLAGFACERAGRKLAAFAAPAALVVLFALAQQLNLRAWFGADAQIRTIRDGIAREVALGADDPVVVAYDVPTEYHGVVTLDLSLALAMRPPFTKPPGIDVFPLIAGQDPPWASRVPELRSWLEARPGRRILHLQCADNPVRVSRLVGALDGPWGASPPDVLAPGDGAIIVHPAEPPTFVFQRVPGAAAYRLRLEADGDAFVIDLDPARDLKRISTRLQFDLGRAAVRARLIDRERHEREIPDAVEAWKGDVFAPPRPVTWTLEALDARGKSLGVSGTRSLVMITANFPR